MKLCTLKPSARRRINLGRQSLTPKQFEKIWNAMSIRLGNGPLEFLAERVG